MVSEMNQWDQDAPWLIRSAAMLFMECMPDCSVYLPSMVDILLDLEINFPFYLLKLNLM